MERPEAQADRTDTTSIELPRGPKLIWKTGEPFSENGLVEKALGRRGSEHSHPLLGVGIAYSFNSGGPRTRVEFFPAQALLRVRVGGGPEEYEARSYKVERVVIAPTPDGPCVSFTTGLPGYGGTTVKLFHNGEIHEVHHTKKRRRGFTRKDGEKQESLTTADFSVAEAAELFGCTPENVYSMLKRGSLEGHKVRGQWRILTTSVDGYRRKMPIINKN